VSHGARDALRRIGAGRRDVDKTAPAKILDLCRLHTGELPEDRD
jgi:hypothetical protein